MKLYIDVPRSPGAASSLTRAQVAQKLGAGTNGYPRPTGVIVPQSLAQICCSSLLPSTMDRRQCGREVVLRVSRSMRRLTPDFLSLEMPHPSAVLRTLPIEDRTRGVLDRLLPVLAKEPAWTVGRYLRIPQFGARCLVDLLAAYEETARSTASAELSPEPVAAGVIAVGIDTGRLDDISRLLPSLLPMSSAELVRLLVDEGLATVDLTLEHLAEVYRGLDRQPPFRVVECGGIDIALGNDTNGFSATVVAAAVRLVSHWGLSSVASLVERVGVLRSAPTSRAFVCRVLVALPRLRWLDSTMKWFSFLGDRSRLARGIARVFAVARSVPFHELRRALGRGRARDQAVPGGVLTRYLSDVAHCQIDGDLVHRSPNLVDAAPTLFGR
jgi:hypothetical protein